MFVKALNKNLWVELLGLTVLLLGLEAGVFPHCFTQWNPGPLWILVILVAMRYGSPAGIVGGSMAACLHLWDLTRVGYTLQELLHRNPQLLIVPVLYVFVGMYLGEVRERLAKRGDHYRARVDELNKQLETSEIKRMNLERAHLSLEKRIAGQPATLFGVYESLNRLNTARNEAELWPILCDILHSGLKAEGVGVWQTDPPRLLAVTGAMAERPPPLLAMAAKKRGVATVVDWAGEQGNKPPGAELAGILVDDFEHPVAIAVSGIGFNQLNRNSAIFFELVLERARFIIQEMRGLEQLRQASINDPELGMFSEGYLRSRVREQLLLVRRHKGTLCLIGCAFKRPPPPDREERFMVILACAIKSALRASDGVAFFAAHKAFGMMLPQTDLAGAEVVMGKIIANLRLVDMRDQEGRSFFELNWRSLVLDGSEDEDMVYHNIFDALAGQMTEGWK